MSDDPYLDAKVKPFEGRVPSDILEEIRAVIDRAYTDGWQDGQADN